MNNSISEMQHLKMLIEQKIQHPFLKKYIQKPFIDDEKLYLLTVILSDKDLPQKEKESYIVTTMLVQIALDAHDLVDMGNPAVAADSEMTKQLTVLAGDYYSGLYYLLLSEIEDFKLIHMLATAIKKINEYKMILFYKEYHSYDEFLDIIKKIESLLFIHVAKHVQEEAIIPIAEEWLLLNRMIREKNLHYRGNYSLCTIWFASSGERGCMEAAAFMKKKTAELLDKMKKQLAVFSPGYDKLKKRISERINTNVEKPSAVEEG